MTAKLSAAAVVILLPAVASAQLPSLSHTDSAATPGKAASALSLDFSGTLFANYQYRGDDGPAKSTNKFDLERAYLTFRVPAGDRLSVRITADVFQQASPGSDSYYRGWTVRAKYAYLQYSYLDGTDWKANARVGLLHTVFIDHDEKYWPRWISPSPTDRAGYFSSSDAGIANTLSFPGKLGELYTTATNGPGYTSRETDRFKDYATRMTVTPWAAQAGSSFQSLALSGWVYRGATASRFATGGTGQAGALGYALDRNRWGLHAGLLNPRLTLGAEYASRQEEGELGENTQLSPATIIDSTGTLASVYALLRPFRLRGARPHPLGLVARYDRVIVNTDTDARYDVIIAGLIWDLSSKASFSVDYQENNPVSGNAIARSHTWFAHFVARF